MRLKVEKHCNIIIILWSQSLIYVNVFCANSMNIGPANVWSFWEACLTFFISISINQLLMSQTCEDAKQLIFAAHCWPLNAFVHPIHIYQKCLLDTASSTSHDTRTRSWQHVYPQPFFFSTGVVLALGTNCDHCYRHTNACNDYLPHQRLR